MSKKALGNTLRSNRKLSPTGETPVTQKANTLFLTRHFENESKMHKQQECNICYPCQWEANKDSSFFPTSEPTSRSNFPKWYFVGSLQSHVLFFFLPCGKSRACKQVCIHQQQKRSSVCKKDSGKNFLFLALILRCLTIIFRGR